MYFPVVNSQSGKSAILMSTPHPYSWFDKFVGDDSNSILKEKFERVCKECMKKEVVEWQYCIHTKFEGALTKDFGVGGIDSLLDPETIAIEDYGISYKEDNMAFDKKELEWFFDKNNYAEVDFTDVLSVYVYMDTNFGGTDRSTFYALCNTENTPAVDVLVWASAKSCKNLQDAESFLLDNILEFRLKTKSYKVPMIICYETVSNFSATVAYKTVQENSFRNEYKNVFFAREPNWVGKENEREGINVYASRKNMYVTIFAESLNKKSIRIWKDIGSTGGNHILKEVGEFSYELSIFRGKDMALVLKRKEDRFKLDNKFNCGKMTINGVKIQDDRAFTMIAINTLKQLFKYDSSFKLQRIEINARMNKKIFSN
jgi:hypothetical protein